MAEHPWPDVEASVMEALRAATGVEVSWLAPADLTVPFVRVTAAGGFDDETTDSPTVDVEAFAPERAEARDLAETCRQAMLALPGRRVGGALFDTTRTVSRPSWVDYANRDVHRFVAVYSVALRRY